MQVNLFYGLLSVEVGPLMICRGKVGGCVWGGGIWGLTAACCQYHDCTACRDPISSGAASWWLTVSTAAAPWRFTFPASISLFAPSGATLEQSLTPTWTRTRARTQFRYALCPDADSRGFSLNSSDGFWNLFDFTKQDHERTVTGVVNVVAGCVSICEAHNGAAGPADNAPRFPVSLSPLKPNKLSRTRQNDSHLGCSRSFFLRYVLLTVSLEINNGGSLKHFKICSCFMRSDTQLDGGW